MNKKEVRVNVYLQIIIAVVLVAISGITYAYFAVSNNIEATSNLTAQMGSSFSFVSSSSSDIEINVAGSDMQKSKVGNYVSSGNGTIKVDLKSPSDLVTTCTYDLLFTYTSEDKYLESSVELPYTHEDVEYPFEFSMIVKDSETGQVIFEERDLSKVNNGAGFTEKDGIYSGTIAENLSIKSENEDISKTYNIEARIYNLPVNQPNLLNKYMTGKIKVENLNCEYDNTGSDQDNKEDNENIDIANLNYLSTNYGNTIFNLVTRQGVDVTNVDSIYFVDMSDISPTNDENVALFKGSDNNVIKAWTNENNLYIGSKGTAYPGPSMSYAFYNVKNLNVIDMNNANTANVTDMSSMFDNTGRSSTVFTLNLGSEFNTSKVTDMTGMFWSTGSNSTNFSLNLGNEFNTSKVTTMVSMFYSIGRNNTNFTLDLGSEFNTSNVTNMYGMFSSTGNINSNFTLNLGNQFNTSKVTDMADMFFWSATSSLNLGNQFNTSNVTDMSDMFAGLGMSQTNFRLNLGNQFNTSKVVDMSYMFDSVETANNFTLNLGSEFNTANVTNMAGMFSFYAQSGVNKTINLGNNFDTSNVINMDRMFSNAGFSCADFTLNLGNKFSTSNVTNMSYMFSYTGYRSSWILNLKSFDFSKVVKYDDFFAERDNSNIITVLCNPTNGDFINARVSGLIGYNVVCS